MPASDIAPVSMSARRAHSSSSSSSPSSRLQETIAEHEQTRVPAKPRDLIDAFLEEMQARKDTVSTYTGARPAVASWQ